MTRRVAAALAVLVAVLALWTPAGANVIPSDPRPGDVVLTRMWCFQGPVTFYIRSSNGSLTEVGTTTGDGGWAELTFTMPNLAPGNYTMVGVGRVGASCATGDEVPGGPRVVEVPFVVRAAGGGGGGYPLSLTFITTNRSSVGVGDDVTVEAGQFKGDVLFALLTTGKNLGTAPADSNGTARITFKAPSDFGSYTVAASGLDLKGSPLTVSTTFSVAPPGGLVSNPIIGNTTVPPTTQATAQPVTLTNDPPRAGASAGVLVIVSPGGTTNLGGTTNSSGNRTTVLPAVITPTPGGGVLVVPTGPTPDAQPSVKVEVAGAQQSAPTEPSKVTLSDKGGDGEGFPLDGTQLAIGGLTVAGALFVTAFVLRRKDAAA